MQHIIIRSSRADSNVLKTNDWITNGANLTGELYIKKKKDSRNRSAFFLYESSLSVGLNRSKKEAVKICALRIEMFLSTV